MTAPHRPAADPTDHDERRRPLLDLSLTQLLGGALAAATGAALASGLGLAGTILGAAAISLVSAIGGAAYTHSLRQTRQRVRSAAGRTGHTRPPGGGPDDRSGGATEAPAAPPAGPVDRPGAPRPRPLLVRNVLVAAAAVFVVAFTAITGYELLTGEPLSGAAGRTTLSTTLTGADDSDARTPEPPAPTTAVPTGDPPPTPTGASTSAPTSSPVPTSSTPSGSSSPPSSGPPTSAPPEPTDPPASPSPPAPSS